MTLRTLAMMALVVCFLPGCSPTTVVVGFGGSTPVSSPDVAARPIGAELRNDVLASTLLAEVNDYRLRHSLPVLSPDPVAADAAGWMARYQAQVTTMTHTATVRGMEDFSARYRKHGGERIVSGAENIAWHQLRKKDGLVTETYEELAGRIVDGWIGSPPHRKNMLLAADRGRGIAGMGVARGNNHGADGVYSTLDLFYVEGGGVSTGG